MSETEAVRDCPRGCAPLYKRDGKWWCLNNYCEYSYFFDHAYNRAGFDRLRVEFHNAIEEGLADIRAGRVVALEEYKRERGL